MFREQERRQLAMEIRTFADRVEDGEYSVQDIEIGNVNARGKPYIKFTAMDADDLQRLQSHIPGRSI